MPVTLRGIKDGTLFDIPDAERDEALATGKFTENYRLKGKKDGKEFIVPAEELPEALDSGKFELAEFYDQKKNIEANPTMPKMNPAASFALKAGNTMSMGFGDEIIGAFGGDKEGIRKQLKASDIQNPTASFAGSLLGGMASPSLVGAGRTITQAIGKGALSGALSGGIQGVGDNEDIKNLGSDVARGVMYGGVIGAGAGAIGKKVGDAVSDYRSRRAPMPQDPAPNIPDQSIKTIGDPVPTMTATDALPEGALSGVRESAANVPTGKSDSEILAELLSKGKDAAKDFPYAIKSGYEGFKKPTGIDGAIVGNAARIPKASSEFFKYFKEADINRQDMADIAGKLRKELPDAASLSDEQLFLQAMSEPGPNSAKVFAANRVKATGGDDKAFLNLLNKAPEETAAGRGFNKIDTAHELAGDLSKTYDSFRAVERKAFEGLKNRARASFTNQGSAPVKAVSDAIQEASQYKTVSGSVKNALDDVFADIAGREGQDAFTAITPAEQFDRILQARQRLDKDIKWASQNELPQGQQILANARSRLDAFLKPLDDMAKADKGYSRFKRLEDELFAKIGTKNQGQIVAFEPTKVEDLLGGTKTSRRLGAALEGFKRQLASGEISPEARGRIEPFIKKLDEAMSKAKTQRDLTAFRYEAGPTSPAVQQLSQKLKPQGIVDLAGQSPQLFLKLRETIPENAKAMFGANYSGLSPSQKEAVAKFSVWRLSNLAASERQVNEVMQTFMKAKK